MGSASDAIATSAWDAATCMLNAIGLAKSRLQHLPTPKDNTQMKQAIDRLMDVLSQIICDIDTCRHAQAMCINQDNIYTFLPQIQEELLVLYQLLSVLEPGLQALEEMLGSLSY